MKWWERPILVQRQQVTDNLRRELEKALERKWPSVTNNDIQQQIDHLRSLLTTPNISQATIDEINTNLQELLRMQRTPTLKQQQVFQD